MQLLVSPFGQGLIMDVESKHQFHLLTDLKPGQNNRLLWYVDIRDCEEAHSGFSKTSFQAQPQRKSVFKKGVIFV